MRLMESAKIVLVIPPHDVHPPRPSTAHFVLDMELAILSSITAAAPSLHRGWNLGNTLDEPKITTSPPTLHRGWNLGDTLDTTQYNPGVNAPWVFDAVKKAGFDWVRIPVHWDPHTSHTPPFAINATWMQTVIETVTWAHASGLVAMVNTHHENWFDNTTTFDSNLPRFLAIWSQIAETFKAVPDSQLVFELLNEPSNIKIDQLNAMNAAVLPVVRKTNPTRQVHFGGLAKMGSWWILQHPDAITIPENDGHLALTVHSYDPYAFAGPGPKTPSGGHIPLITTFTATDAAKGVATMKFLGEWGRNRSMPVVHDEFGCTVMQPNRTARLLYYKTYARAAEAAGVAWAVWDDDGWFQILRRRGNRTWDAEVLAQLVPPSNAAEEPAAGAQCTPYSATGIDYADANLSVVPATDGWPGCCKACTAFGTQCKVAVYLKDESLCTLKATAKKPVKAHHVVAVSMGPPPTPPPPNPSAMDLYIIPQKVADAAGAKCLDGTPPAFYYRAANTSADASASSKYVLYFKGGGWCYNETSCAARAGGIIGSSQNLNKSQPTFTSEGPLDAIAAANPEFANWHHIELWYCDGGSFSGDLDNSVSVDGKEIWFRGRRNLATILDHLNEETFGDLSKATDVRLSSLPYHIYFSLPLSHTHTCMFYNISPPLLSSISLRSAGAPQRRKRGWALLISPRRLRAF